MVPHAAIAPLPADGRPGGIAGARAMIVRAWWPLQDAVGRRPLNASAALAGLGAGALLGFLRLGCPRTVLLALLGGAAAVALQVHGVAAQAAAAAALATAVAVAAFLTADGADLAVLAPAAALLLGAGAELARRRPAGQRQHGIGRATALLALGAQAGILATWDRPALCLAVAVAALLGVALVAPLAARRGHEDVHGAAALTAESDDGAGRWIMPVLLLAVLLPGLAWPAPAPADGALDLPRLLPVLAPLALLWALLIQRPVPILAAVLGLAGGAAVVAASGLPGDRAAIGAAQVVPLLAWMAREAQGGVPWPVRFAATAVLAGTALLLPAWMPAAVIAAGATLGIACCPFPRAIPGHGLAAARRWLHRLEPWWRWHGLAKLALDPVYARLAGDGRPWGRVLDLGCGYGLGAALAAARDGTAAYHGIDLDRDKLLVARRLLRLAGHALDGAWRLEQAAAPLAQPPIGPFDTILLIDVLHYWPRPVQAAVLAQLHGLLADDGVLWLREGVAVAGDAGTVARGERFTTWFGLNPRGALHFPDRDGLLALLAGCGFACAGIEPCGGENRLLSARKVPREAPRQAVGEAGHEGGEAGQPAAGA
jgi:SAM-dependent methyltransferase